MPFGGLSTLFFGEFPPELDAEEPARSFWGERVCFYFKRSWKVAEVGAVSACDKVEKKLVGCGTVLGALPLSRCRQKRKDVRGKFLGSGES